MKNILLFAVLASGITVASAQTPGSGGRSGASNSKPVTGNPVTASPNGPVARAPKPGQAVNTAPATGANRASRSSSTVKAASQGTATASSNPQSMPKNSAVRPGKKK